MPSVEDRIYDTETKMKEDQAEANRIAEVIRALNEIASRVDGLKGVARDTDVNSQLHKVQRLIEDRAKHLYARQRAYEIDAELMRKDIERMRRKGR